MLSTVIFLVWVLSIAATAVCAKLNNLHVMGWTFGAVVAGPLIFVPLGLWIDRMKDKE